MRLESEYLGGRHRLPVTDRLGSGSLSRDEAGVTAVQSYTPFGAVRGGGGNALPTDLTFTRNPKALEEFPGCLRRDDPGTGLIDYNARAYDPVLRRFVMADTVLPGSGQLLNRYSYVGNSPTGFTDPSGHEPCRGIGNARLFWPHLGGLSRKVCEVSF